YHRFTATIGARSSRERTTRRPSGRVWRSIGIWGTSRGSSGAWWRALEGYHGCLGVRCWGPDDDPGDAARGADRAGAGRHGGHRLAPCSPIGTHRAGGLKPHGVPERPGRGSGDAQGFPASVPLTVPLTVPIGCET